MDVYLNGKIFRNSDIDSICNELANLNISTITNEVKEQLIEIFNKTDNNRLRDTVALIFADLSDIHIVPVLINKINEIKYSKHISTLIYACSEYDCAEWITFFVKLVIDLDDSSYIEAISVIDEIKTPIKLSDKIICIKRLTEYRSEMDKESEKYEEIERLIEVIDDMDTVY